MFYPLQFWGFLSLSCKELGAMRLPGLRDDQEVSPVESSFSSATMCEASDCSLCLSPGVCLLDSLFVVQDDQKGSYPLVMTDIAIDKSPLIVDLP